MKKAKKISKTSKLKKTNKKINQPTLLVILDGFGLADPKNKGNAITPETAPNIFGYIKKYPNSKIITYGEKVGLFKGQQGNSEAGHINIGAGRIVKQDLVQISDAIHDGTFFKNEAFKQAIYHVKKYNTAVHIMGLLTDGNSAHAYPEHFHALLEYFRREEVGKVYLHLFTDGRDSSPHGAADFLREMRGHMLAHEKIATIMGRFYAMDRNKIWSRTQQAYEAMVLGRGGCKADSAEDALSQSYNRDETDEFLCPTIIMEKSDGSRSKKKAVATIKDNDAVFFINSRSDRARQITKCFVQKDFNKKNRGSFHRTKVLKNIRFVAMTDFGPDLDHLMTAFPSPDLTATLPMVLKNKKQLYIAESEKYAHVTYFINGGYADPINGEIRMKIESPLVRSYEEKPEMAANGITAEVIRYMDRLDFICVNFANADMVGHTGNFEAGKKAVSTLDNCIFEIVQECLKRDGQILITADHGNADEMINLETNEMMTEHTLNPVPCILISNKTRGVKMKDGILADIAPTILQMMNVDKPREMTGRSLI
ncbi:2,3-bisphosphoglycerate-independent phosphoglycerate mutase [Patescibacteria group bacterium]|nr:2,3-bisphosphoglycerate-independent phosphoglycerate mutase [Patescibacteria group bacterium]